MVPFAMALREIGGSAMKSFPGIPADDMHNIQTYASYLTWLVSDLSDGVKAKHLSELPTHNNTATALFNLSALVCVREQEKAYSYQDVEVQRHSNCPVPSGVLTPPLSSEKTEDLLRADASVPKIRPRMCTPSPQRNLPE